MRYMYHTSKYPNIDNSKQSTFLGVANISFEGLSSKISIFLLLGKIGSRSRLFNFFSINDGSMINKNAISNATLMKLATMKVLNINLRIPDLQNDFFPQCKRCNYNELRKHIVIVVILKRCSVLRYCD